MIRLWMMHAAVIAVLTAGATAHAKMEMRIFPVLAGAGAHDVYPAPDGAVWFTAQSDYPRTGRPRPVVGLLSLSAHSRVTIFGKFSHAPIASSRQFHRS